jgi:hypothetical protein
MSSGARIYQLLLGTLQVMSAPDRGVPGPGPGLDRPGSLRNHAPAPRRRHGRPKLLGHDGFPAGLSNGRKPEPPAGQARPGMPAR